MEIGLIAYVLYTFSVLIWCSVQDGYANVNLVSLRLLQQWLLSRSDLIFFELHPGRDAGMQAGRGGNFLTITPSGLTALMDWIPPGSTLVFCNHGVSRRAVLEIQKQMALRDVSGVFWLNEVA